MTPDDPIEVTKLLQNPPPKPEIDPFAALLGRIAMSVILGSVLLLLTAATLGFAVRIFLFCAGL